MVLFSELKIRETLLKNRIGISPMCQYSSEDGVPNSWHLVHLGSRAVGGAALIICEATAIEPAGRISPGDTGIYNDKQVEAWRPITEFIKAQGSVPAIQLAHAGRKASTAAPWKGGKPITPEQGGWAPIYSSSPLPFSEGCAIPHELTIPEIKEKVEQFKQAAVRSLVAGFQVAEIHAAHGYLINQFLSPISNHRKDIYGGNFENRIRFLKEITIAVRSVWPEHLPLFVRISATDWVDGGWDLDQSIELARELKKLGIDLIDVSSGGTSTQQKIPVAPGYQVQFASEIRKHAHIATAAVGLITEPHQADEIIKSGQADFILLGRESLRDPYWPRTAAKVMGAQIIVPSQYLRAW